MNTKALTIALIVGVIIVTFAGCFISKSNQEIGLKNKFTQKKSERTAMYDKMWKTLSGKSQVALKNDSSFQQVVNIQMQGQKDGEGVMWKWIQQSNPTATFAEVSSLYKDLSRAIESKREEFFESEKMLQDIKLQHDNLMSKFPSSFILWILGRKKLEYAPITSDRTDDVFKTNKDNNVNVFN